MNIFPLHDNPHIAAQMLCDQHLQSQLKESVQLLSTAHPSGGPYRPFSPNHPCVKWTKRSRANFRWLRDHAEGMHHEYIARFDNEHGSGRVLMNTIWDTDELPDGPRTPFARVFGGLAEPLGLTDVQAYRWYYLVDKSRFARWSLVNGCCRVPNWYHRAMFAEPARWVQILKEEV